jgi:hypothetical protein
VDRRPLTVDRKPLSIVGCPRARAIQSPARRALAGAALLVALAAPGCVNLTLFQSSMGHAIDPASVARLEKGKSRLSDVLELLGAPQEVHAHPDGRLLVYRCKGRTSIEFGVSAGNVTMAVDVARAFSWILDLLKFTLVSTETDEDRVAIVLDRSGIVRGVAFREKLRELPLF